MRHLEYRLLPGGFGLRRSEGDWLQSEQAEGVTEFPLLPGSYTRRCGLLDQWLVSDAQGAHAEGRCRKGGDGRLRGQVRGLQGYLVSNREVEKFNIQSLDDFKCPEVKAAFDSNKDGKAGLVACPPGWGCETTITYHLDVYGMKDHINPIKAGYTAGTADALARYETGKPVFFFTRVPNWTIYQLKPGRDVMWINVPEIKARPVELETVDRMTVSGVEGAVTDPAPGPSVMVLNYF
jgi:hypothetical protein